MKKEEEELQIKHVLLGSDTVTSRDRMYFRISVFLALGLVRYSLAIGGYLASGYRSLWWERCLHRFTSIKTCRLPHTCTYAVVLLSVLEGYVHSL